MNNQQIIKPLDLANEIKPRLISVRGQLSLGDNLSTDSTKTTIELNLAVLKITHEVTRTKKRD